MTSLNRTIALLALSFAVAAVLGPASASAAPSFEIGLERDAATVSHSDERIEYAVKVKNLTATPATSASVGDLLFCAGAHPIKTWAPFADQPENSFEWLRNGESIPGQTADVYTATAADSGKAIQCLVKGTNAAGAAVEASLPASTVAPPPATAPPAPGNPLDAASRPAVVPTAGAATIARTCTPPTNWSGANTGSASITSGSKTLTAVSSAPYAVGQQITGAGIPAGTTIAAVGAGTLELSANATVSGTGVPISAQSAGAGATTVGSSTITDLVAARGTGTTASGSTAVTALSTSVGRWAVGLPVSGAGIPAGTTVTAATATSLTLSQAATASASGVELTAAGPLPFAVGQEIDAAGIPAGTTVVAVGAGSIELSAAATASASGVAIAGTSAGKWRFQWLRNAQPIAGATSYAHRPAPGDEGSVLQCRVIATNAGASVLAVSNTTTVGTLLRAPSNITANTPVTIADVTTVRLQLPGGLGTHADPRPSPGWSCTRVAAAPSQPAEALCAAYQAVSPGSSYPVLTVGAVLGADAPDLAIAKATVSGSGAVEATSATDEFTFDPFREFGLSAFDVKVSADPAETVDYVQAGGHPVAATAGFTMEMKRRLGAVDVDEESAKYQPIEELRSVIVDTPRGFVGNALAVPKLCPSVEAVIAAGCPRSSIVGGIQLVLTGVGDFGKPQPFEIYAIEPEFGKPAQFAFTDPLQNLFTFAPVLRADDGYAISIVAAPSPEVSVLQARPTLCGYGLKEIKGSEVICKEADEAGANPIPLITNPTRCSGPPPTIGIAVDSWLHPGDFKRYETTTPALEGCDKIPFEPSAELVPTNSRADSPTGMSVEISMPTNGVEGKDEEGNRDPDAVSQANLNTATVTFPKGMSINPAAADGLQACSLAQLKYHSNESDECPPGAKVGTVEVETPLIREALAGNVYVAKQRDNPFGSTLGLYLVFDSKKDGIVVKIAGKLVPNPVTGQLTSIFTENPEVPFSRVSLRFNGGPRAPLINPPQCGIYAIHSEFSPWTAVNPANPTPAEIVSQDSEFQVTEGPGGGPCPGGGLDPKLKAGLANPTAAAKSPFVLSLSRADGSGRFTGLELTMPKGLTAYLKGIPYCPDNVLAGISAAEETGRGELANPACPAASQVGTVSAGAGAGAFPFYAPGKAYLAGPYKGAPLSLAVVTPAVAGPFDLGNVVIRNALHVDPETAQVTAKSDPIPTILHGLLLDVRDVRVNLDRPNFTAAPTSCAPMSIDGSVRGEGGTAARVSYPFQAGGCEALGFKPKLSLRLFGGTKRGAYPRLRATLTARPGDANIAAASVALPHSAFLAQEHIRTICTRVQFAAKQCPAGSIYGQAEATTPLLDGKVSGPVYLRSSSNPLPDLVAALRGPDYQPIEVVLRGRVDSVNGGIRNSFDVVPDAPVSSFVLNMRGGKKSLLVNSRDICKSVNKATARFTAHSGKRVTLRPKLTNSCKKARKTAGKKQQR